MIQRYKKAHTLSLIWFSSITSFFSINRTIRLSSARLSMGHFREGEMFPEYPIIASETSLTPSQALVHYNFIRRVEKYTFSTYSDTSLFRWNLLECFINEFLPEMDVYRETKVRKEGADLVYRRRGRCLEFVRAFGLKTARTTWRRLPYPFTLTLSYLPRRPLLKDIETYFRIMRLPIRVYRRINRWWLAKKYWEW